MARHGMQVGVQKTPPDRPDEFSDSWPCSGYPLQG